MTAMRGYIPATTDQRALGVHSLDHFVLAVPDLKPAQRFYSDFGLDVREDGNALALKTFGHDPGWAGWWRALANGCITCRSAATRMTSPICPKGRTPTALSCSIRPKASKATASGCAIPRVF